MTDNFTRDPLLHRWLKGLRNMFNLNSPGWGRGNGSPPEDKNNEAKPVSDKDADTIGQDNDQRPNESERPQKDTNPKPNPPEPNKNAQQSPPDLDDLLKDLNRKLTGLFGGAGKRQGKPPKPPVFGGGGSGKPGGSFKLPAFNGSIVITAALVLLAIWLTSGFFIVQEGHQAVVTRFGKYNRTVDAGLNYRLPSPAENHELVLVTQIQSVDIGNDRLIQETGLNHYAMLTEDENIVEVRFAVQYRLNDARQWLFETQDPNLAVVTAAESAVREVVGKMKMDNVLAGERDQIAPRVRDLVQIILNRYKVGVEVVAINMQQSGVRPPEQVRDAFDDVLRADQERERAKNEAEAYANNVVPRAVGEASRMRENALAYKDRIVAYAQGDANRFAAIESEYKKAPQVTRDRMYLETLEEVYGKSRKILVDSKNGSSLMYLPLDKMMNEAVADDSSNAKANLSNGATGNNYQSGSGQGAANLGAPSVVFPDEKNNNQVSNERRDTRRSVRQTRNSN